MPDAPAPSPSPSSTDQGRRTPADLERALAELRIDRTAGPGQLYAELDAARESLQVACAEVRAQQEDLARMRDDLDRGESHLVDLSHGIVALSALLAEQAPLRDLASMAAHRVATLFADASVSLAVGDPRDPEAVGTSTAARSWWTTPSVVQTRDRRTTPGVSGRPSPPPR